MDLEKLLQQYGEDQRQQQQAAKRVRQAARRQRRTLTGIACAALLLTTSLWILNRPKGTLQEGNGLTASQTEQTTDGGASVPRPAADETLPATHELHHGNRRIPDPVVAKSEPDDTLPTALPTLLPTEDFTLAPSLLAKQTPADTEEPTEIHTGDLSPADSLSDTPDSEPFVPELRSIDIATSRSQADPHLLAESDRRFRFIASVGASTMAHSPTAAMDTPVIPMENGYQSANEISTATVHTPLYSFSANAGVSYALLQMGKSTTSVGLILSGQAQRGDIDTYTFSTNGVDGVDGTTGRWVEDADRKQNYNHFNLYAGIPLTIDMKPMGKGSAGWNLSLTPAHALFSTQALGAMENNAFVPNPWRLTLGAGITLPKRFPRSINLTANLLPVYTSVSFHEIGIEIGF